MFDFLTGHITMMINKEKKKPQKFPPEVKEPVPIYPDPEEEEKKIPIYDDEVKTDGDAPMEISNCRICRLQITSNTENTITMCCYVSLHVGCLEKIIKDEYLAEKKVSCPSCKEEFS